MNAPLPNKRDEAWRYADLKLLEGVWDDISAPEQITIKAGESLSKQIIDIESLGNGVAIADLDVTIEDGATFALHLLCSGAQYGRINVRATLGKRSHFELGGAILGNGDQKLEIVTETIHAQPEATSNQVVRSVLGGKASGTFMGKVHVARDAQRTDAAQSVKSMLLDRTATANNKPELEIFADDVLCAHGATVGELDQNALFYMASRGLDPETAKRLMLQAFIGDAFVSAGDDAREDIESKALAILEGLS